jgi:hypothetical protein
MQMADWMKALRDGIASFPQRIIQAGMTVQEQSDDHWT